MLRQVSKWKYITVLVVATLSFIYAAPNLYPDDAAIQVTGYHSTDKVTEQNVANVKTALAGAAIHVKQGELQENGSMLIRLVSKEDQLHAKDVVEATLGERYSVALNLAPTAPKWLTTLGAQAMTLGLDLSGGVHFLMEVDLKEAVNKRLTMLESDIKRQLQEKNIYYSKTSVAENSITIHFADNEMRAQARPMLAADFPQFDYINQEEEGVVAIKMNLLPPQVKQIENDALDQNLTTMRNRVNGLGVSEPLVQRQGRNRIVIELPGVQDTAGAKDLLGTTANLEFRLAAENTSTLGLTEEFVFRDNPQQTARLERAVILTGENVTSAQATTSPQDGRPQVSITLNDMGGEAMFRASKNNVGRGMGVLFIEQRSINTYEMVDGKQVIKRIPKEEKGIISLAVIKDVLGKSFVISGLEKAEATKLALLLRSGSLAAPMYFVEERTVGPSAGAENIKQGVKSAIIAGIFVMGFMLLVYRVFGLMANIALVLNVVLLVGVLSLPFISATLTLPGIAGIALTMGIAVDANVLIFARIREELKHGLAPGAAIEAGFDRAFLTIIDSHLTGLIIGILLFAIGTGPVKGFALTLSVGILASLFTAITVTRCLIDLIADNKKLSKIML